MRRTGKKALTLITLSVLAAGMTLTGCGKTDVEYSLDDGAAGTSDDGGTLAASLGIPDSYTGAVEGIDAGTGLTEVSIDAPTIRVPDSDSMSVVYYENNNCDSEYKKRVCEAFFDVDSGIYLHDWDKRYRGDVEDELERRQQVLKSLTNDADIEYMEGYISSLESELESASDEREGAGDYSGADYVGYVGDNMYMISFMESESGETYGFSLMWYPNYSLVSYRPVDGATDVTVYPDADSGEGDSANEASIGRDEAVQIGLEFLSGCGITDVAADEVCDLVWDYMDSGYNTIASAKNGYTITYKRAVNGTPMYTPYVYNISLLTSENVWYDTQDESYEVYVDDSGVIYAYCYDYYRATGEVDENVSLLTWDEALAALPGAINKYYAGGNSGYSSVKFNDVRLVYYKINDNGTIKAVPVWVFAECDKLYTGDALDVDSPQQLVLLNAATGELIDLRNVLDSHSYETTEIILTEEDLETDEAVTTE